MAAINTAYEVLSDPGRRAEHDLWIRRAERPAQPLPAGPATPQTLWDMLHPASCWAWYLLAGTLALALGTIATACYLTAMPARAATAPLQPPCAVASPAVSAGCNSPN
jgi:hypothetical protein